MRVYFQSNAYFRYRSVLEALSLSCLVIFVHPFFVGSLAWVSRQNLLLGGSFFE
jgi:hypothetical protein